MKVWTIYWQHIQTRVLMLCAHCPLLMQMNWRTSKFSKEKHLFVAFFLIVERHIGKDCWCKGTHKFWLGSYFLAWWFWQDVRRPNFEITTCTTDMLKWTRKQRTKYLTGLEHLTNWKASYSLKINNYFMNIRWASSISDTCSTSYFSSACAICTASECLHCKKVRRRSKKKTNSYKKGFLLVYNAMQKGWTWTEGIGKHNVNLFLASYHRETGATRGWSFELLHHVFINNIKSVW